MQAGDLRVTVDTAFYAGYRAYEWTGERQVPVRVRDTAGVERWMKACPLKTDPPSKRPFALVLIDEDLPVLPLAEGPATIEAVLSNSGDLPGSRLVVPVFDAKQHPRIKGTVQVVGMSDPGRALLTAYSG